MKGIQNQNKAADAAQQQANLATGAGTAGNQDTAIMAYFNSDPAFAAEYNRNRIASNGTDNRTPAQWLTDGLRSNPEQMTEFQSFVSGGSAAPGAGGAIPGSAIGPGGTVDVNILQQQAQAVARQNAENSAALEREFNPGAAELRKGGLEAILAGVGTTPEQQALRNLISGRLGAVGTGATVAAPATVNAATLAAQAGLTPERYAAALINPESYSTVDVRTDRSASSPLLQAAVEQAQQQLALGGLLPQDVRNLVARTAAARSGSVTRGLGLGRDIAARDLGLTSLDLMQRRLTNAQSLGQAALSAEQFNTGLQSELERYNATARNTAAADLARLRQSASEFNAGATNQASAQNASYRQQVALANQAAAQAAEVERARLAQQANLANQAAANQAAAQQAQMAQQASQFDAGYFADQSRFLSDLSSGDFARALAAGQLGQGIQQPISGLNPGSVADVAIGNVNLANNAQQQANAVRAQTGANQTTLGGQLLGSSLPGAIDYFKNFLTPTPTLKPVTVGAGYGSNIPSIPGWSPSTY